MYPPSQEVTQLLVAWSGGELSPIDKLISRLHRDPRRSASHGMYVRPFNHPLQTRGPVNEACVRWVDCQLANLAASRVESRRAP